MHTHTLLRIVLHSLLTQTLVPEYASVCAQFDSFLVFRLRDEGIRRFYLF